MISIMRANIGSEKPLGSRMLNELDEDNSNIPLINCIKRVIVIRNIDPEEFENQEVNDMSEEDKDLSAEELDSVENEIPKEIDNMSDEDLKSGDGIDDIDDSVEGGELDGSDEGDMSDEEISALEKEIPPEADQLKDEDLESDPDLEDEETEDEPVAAVENEEDLDEGVKINDYI